MTPDINGMVLVVVIMYTPTSADVVGAYVNILVLLLKVSQVGIVTPLPSFVTEWL